MPISQLIIFARKRLWKCSTQLVQSCTQTSRNEVLEPLLWLELCEIGTLLSAEWTNLRGCKEGQRTLAATRNCSDRSSCNAFTQAINHKVYIILISLFRIWYSEVVYESIQMQGSPKLNGVFQRSLHYMIGFYGIRDQLSTGTVISIHVWGTTLWDDSLRYESGCTLPDAAADRWYVQGVPTTKWKHQWFTLDIQLERDHAMDSTSGLDHCNFHEMSQPPQNSCTHSSSATYFLSCSLSQQSLLSRIHPVSNRE
jgi:hypothetical protein